VGGSDVNDAGAHVADSTDFMHINTSLLNSSSEHFVAALAQSVQRPFSESVIKKGCDQWVMFLVCSQCLEFLSIRVRTIVTIRLSLQPIVAVSDDYRAR